MRMRAVYVGSIFKFKGQSRPSQQDKAESHRGNARGIVAILNRIEHGMLYTHSGSASYRIDGYSQLRQRPAAPSAKL